MEEMQDKSKKHSRKVSCVGEVVGSNSRVVFALTDVKFYSQFLYHCIINTILV